MGFNIVLYSSTLFFSDSCEFLPSNQYILLNLSPKWLRLYISLPVQLSVEMHTEIFGYYFSIHVTAWYIRVLAVISPCASVPISRMLHNIETALPDPIFDPDL